MSETPDAPDKRPTYWRENVRLVAVLLAVWFAVSFGCGILLVDFLNQFRVAGFELGFWFAQQGSIYVFLVLILVYAVRMAAIDRRHGAEDDEAEEAGEDGRPR